RSLRDQEVVAERQQTLLYQGVADNVARAVSDAVAEQQQAFNSQVELLLGQIKAQDLPYRFHAELLKQWPLAEVGFIVSVDGQVMAPTPFDGPGARQFRLDNDRFLCNRESVEVYWSTPKGTIPQSKFDSKDKGTGSESKAGDSLKTKGVRIVVPEKVESEDPAASKVAPEAAQFQRIVGDSREGTLARFLQDKLKLLFWYRSERDQKLVFGAEVNIAQLTEELRPALRLGPPLDAQVCIALLNDSGRPVAQSHPGYTPETVSLGDGRGGAKNLVARVAALPNLPAGTNDGRPDFTAANRNDWKHPLVAAEIGEVLPHWEVAV